MLGLVDHVGTHRVLRSANHGSTLVSKLVLEDRDHAGAGSQRAIQLLLKRGLASFEIFVEVRQNSVKRDLVFVGAVPVIHVGLESLTLAITIESKALVEAEESQTSHALRKV